MNGGPVDGDDPVDGPGVGAVAHTVVDSSGRRCPLPVIDVARAAATAAPGDVLVLLATDPAARHDVPAWCRLRGHTLVSSGATDGVYRFEIRVRAHGR